MKPGERLPIPGLDVVALSSNGTVINRDLPGGGSVNRYCEQEAIPHLTFLIGGAYGLPPQVSQTSNIQLSLSSLTLPHRLARLMLAEQLYRAFTILRNEPYNH